MKLKDILNEIMEEVDDGLEAITDEEDNVVEFPNLNFTMSIFRDTKKLLFSPQDHSSIPQKLRTFINELKENFRISAVTQKDMGAFEVTLDPRTDLDSVIDYIKQTLSEDGNF